MEKHRDRMRERQPEMKDQHDKTSRKEDLPSLYTGQAVRILHHQKKTLFRWHRSGHVQRATTNDSAHRVRRVECWPSTLRTYYTSPCWHRSASPTQPWTMATTGARHSWGIVNQLIKKKVKVWFYIALYPVRWTAQSALHSPPLADLFIPTPFSASLGSILAMQQLRNDYSLTFPPLSIARYSFIQLSRLRRREMKENAQTSKRCQRGFEPGLSRLRVRHSTNWATALHNRIETLTSNWHDLLFTSFTDTLVSFLTMFWTHGLLNYLFTYLFVYFNCIMDF